MDPLAESVHGLASQEVFIDVSTHQRLIGQLAVEAHIEAGGHPADIVPIYQALTDSDITIVHAKSGRPRSELSEKGLIIETARWLANVCRPRGDTPRTAVLNRPILARASLLELIASERIIKEHFGNRAGLYIEAGETQTNRRYQFDSWTRADFASYAAELTAELGRKPERKDYKAASVKDVTRPSPTVIRRTFGTIGALNELQGFPIIRGWTTDDYIDWGIKYMKANRGQRPVQRGLRILSRAKRGPSDKSIADKFGGSLKTYYIEVERAYQAGVEIQRRNRAAQITRALENFELRPGLFKGSKSPEDIIHLFAKFKVTSKVLPSTSREQRIAIARQPLENQAFIEAIRVENPFLTAAVIEDVAKKEDFYDDIWPNNEYLQTLCLDNYPDSDELAKAA